MAVKYRRFKGLSLLKIISVRSYDAAQSQTKIGTAQRVMTLPAQCHWMKIAAPG
jgi:hypothetical protein